MNNDFEKIAADLRMHFCPLCKSSFGCEIDEDRDCDCVGQEYASDWRKPWCPACYDLRKAEEACTCNCKWTGGWFHSKECAKYDPDQEKPEQYAAYIAGLFRRDMSDCLGKSLPYSYACTACDMAECNCEACRSCQCPDCKEERKSK